MFVGTPAYRFNFALGKAVLVLSANFPFSSPCITVAMRHVALVPFEGLKHSSLHMTLPAPQLRIVLNHFFPLLLLLLLAVSGEQLVVLLHFPLP